MSLTVTEYRVECDVKGCDNVSVGTLGSLIVRGYCVRLLFDGKPVLYPLNHASAEALNQPCICSSCREDKSYLQMQKTTEDMTIVSISESKVSQPFSNEFMVQCPACAGQGNYKPDGLTIKPCPKCKGKKMVPAEEGKAYPKSQVIPRSTSI